MNGSDERTGWFVVMAGFLCLTVAAGIGWYVFPVYMPSIGEETGWSFTQMSIAISVWALAGAVFSPFVGTWIDRYGPRKVMTVGTVAQMFAALGIARMTALWHMYIFFILSSFASVANTHIPIATVISQWFDEKRGSAMGIALLGMGFGGLLMPVLATIFLERYGWRVGYLIFAGFLLALLVPINLWIRRKPAETIVVSGSADEVNRHVSSEAPAFATEGGVLSGLSVAESARTRSFWTLGIGDFLIAIVFTGVMVHMVTFTLGAGHSQASATYAYSTFLVVNTVGILVFGAAADKIKIQRMMIFCYAVPAAAMFFLFRLESLWLIYLFAIIFGISGGGRSALWPLSLGECFGVKHLGALLGWLNVAFMMGNALGPLLGGYIYDKTLSYRLLFIICIAVSLVSSLFISRMRNERLHTPRH